jgi:hypothetical protein
MLYLPFHVDRRILGERRAWLEEARSTLEEDAHGTLRISYHYDFDSSEPVQNLEGWQIVELSETTPAAQHFDDYHKMQVLGECDPEHHIVYLFHERVDTHDTFVHVAMHEILHAVGLPHVSGDSHAIMAPRVVPKLPLHMSTTDLVTLCATIGCKEIRP